MNSSLSLKRPKLQRRITLTKKLERAKTKKGKEEENTPVEKDTQSPAKTEKHFEFPTWYEIRP